MQFFKKRARPKEISVHQQLSEVQHAYSVIPPVHEDMLPLFQIIIIDPVRPKSPRMTSVNLRKKFETIQPNAEEYGFDASVICQFLIEFTQVSFRTAPQTVRLCVSEDSVRTAGLNISALSRVSRSPSSTMRQLLLSPISFDSYVGQNLRKLLWEYATPVLTPILEELETELSWFQGDRALLGIVTKRMASEIGISRTEEKRLGSKLRSFVHGTEVGASYEKRASTEVYDNLRGISGLHFIVVPVECIGSHKWRCYRGINVCDSEVDEDGSQDSLRRDTFYQAMRWRHGEEIVDNLSHWSNYKTATSE